MNVETTTHPITNADVLLEGRKLTDDELAAILAKSNVVQSPEDLDPEEEETKEVDINADHVTIH